MKKHKILRMTCVGLLLAVLCQPALAGQPNCVQPNCGQPCQTCQPQYQTVERTIMVPSFTTETRTVCAVEVQAQERQYTRQVCRMVPQWEKQECEVNVPKYETHYKTVNYTVCKPVMSTVERECTVMVPTQETRQGSRQVCRMVAETAKRTVCVDQGSWQQVTQCYTVCCNGCPQTVQRVCNVWAPNVVTKEVEYQVMKPVMETVNFEYSVTVCKPEVRKQQIQVCNYVQETQEKQVAYQTCTMVKQTVARDVMVCKMVNEQVVEKCVVPVCVNVQKQVQVQVCKMVPQTIQCQVPVNCCPPRGCCSW